MERAENATEEKSWSRWEIRAGVDDLFGTLTTEARTQMRIEPLGNQFTIRLPPGPRMPHPVSHDETGIDACRLQPVQQSL